MDWMLLISAIVILVLLVGMNIYLLWYYGHPDDKDESVFGMVKFCKILVVKLNFLP